MGEVPEQIFPIGSPETDVMLSDNLPSLEQVRAKYAIPFTDYAILIYHPVTTELHLIPKHITGVLDGIKSSELNFVVIYPNNDSGSEFILEGLRNLDESRFRLLPSMRFEYFLALLKRAKKYSNRN